MATASLAAVEVFAQTPPAPAPDFSQAALESHQRNSAVLARFEIPMSVEPAFSFKA